VNVQEEYQKFEGLPSYILHKASHSEADKLGTFHNPTPTKKGLRMDLLCLKVNEEYHPQVIALRDNVTHNRPFGGFSPDFDIEVDMVTGAVESIMEARSIDLVAQPASVKSAVEEHTDQEEDDARYVKKEDLEKVLAAHEELKENHASLLTRVAALECRMPVKAVEQVVEQVSEGKGVRTVPIPETAVKTVQSENPFLILK
jgi:hypothetical protein